MPALSALIRFTVLSWPLPGYWSGASLGGGCLAIPFSAQIVAAVSEDQYLYISGREAVVGA